MSFLFTSVSRSLDKSLGLFMPVCSLIALGREEAEVCKHTLPVIVYSWQAMSPCSIAYESCATESYTRISTCLYTGQRFQVSSHFDLSTSSYLMYTCGSGCILQGGPVPCTMAVWRVNKESQLSPLVHVSTILSGNLYVKWAHY